MRGTMKQFILLPLFLVFCSGVVQAQQGAYRPVIDGDWWSITTNPKLERYAAEHQEPVDFAVWQAKDGTWQLWSCIRNTHCGGKTRLFYGWEADHITDTNWRPKGIVMEADTTLGEEQGGLQAPYVMRQGDEFYMFYGDWNRICLATSKDGKTFTRIKNEKGEPALFTDENFNPRDPMVIKVGNLYYCYYMANHKDWSHPKAWIFCRTSANLKDWSQPVLVSSGGTPARTTQAPGGDAECPFVLPMEGEYLLFRNQYYGLQSLNNVYCSLNPFDFGVDTDKYFVGKLQVAAPEIVRDQVGQFYIVSLKRDYDGMKAAKIKFVRKK